MATEMRYLAHINYWAMMGYCISALYTEAAMYIKPHYYLGAKIDISSIDMIRGLIIGINEFSPSFSFS